MRNLVAILLLTSLAGAAAYHGVFYVTGSQFYEGCWDRRAKEKAAGLQGVGAGSPSEAVLWASCTPTVAMSMDNAGLALGSSASTAPADARALAGLCPDRQTEIPAFIGSLYIVAVDTIEQTGGPSLIDHVAPAGWLIERALKTRWPRCVDAARPYLAKARKASG